MSEQWWAVKHKLSDGFCFVHPDEQEARSYADGDPRNDYKVVPVRIVEDAGPCDTEKGMVDPVSYFKEMGYSYCPYCGRDLEES